MTLTGRAALAALTGALVILAFRDAAALVVVNGLLLAAIAADLALAAPIRPLLLSRGGLHRGTGTDASTASSTPSAVAPSSSASGRSCTRCRRVGRASALTSSGIT